MSRDVLIHLIAFLCGATLLAGAVPRDVMGTRPAKHEIGEEGRTAISDHNAGDYKRFQVMNF